MSRHGHLDKPHLVLVPLFAPGHIIPMIDMARLLAERGADVSFVTTPVNAARTKPVADRVRQAGLPIRFLELRFPTAEAGLPEGCECVDLLPSNLYNDFFHNFFAALPMLRWPLLQALRQLQPPPTCIISDSCNPWTALVARDLGIPRIVFHGPSCLYTLCTHIIYRDKINERVTELFESFVVPDVPHKIEVTRAQSLGFFDAPGWEEIHNEVIKADSEADGFVLNSSSELESIFIDSYRKEVGKKVWAIGPVSTYNKDVEDKVARGKAAAVSEDGISSWLDSQEAKSVVFVSFGSITTDIPSHLFEIGLGLEASKRPFIWVVKAKDQSLELDKWLSEGFAERTSSRSLIIKGWAPQTLILSHPAVGGFMTHCGWNSTVEAVSAGVPMITWPHVADQFLNEKLVVEVWGIGVAIGIKVPVILAAEGDEALVRREDVERAVVRLMDGGKEGEERRRRAKELAEKVNKSMEEGGSSHTSLDMMIHDIMQMALLGPSLFSI